MIVAVLGAGAMGAALTVPLVDNGNEVRLWGTEYDLEILKTIEGGEKHPRIGVPLSKVSVFYPEQIEEVLVDSDVVLLAVSTDGVIPVFKKIKEYIDDQYLITISKGLLEIDGKTVTVPEALWAEREDLKMRTVAITGPAIAREVAKRMPTKVVFSSVDGKAAEEIAKLFRTDYYGVEVSDDIRGAEITSAMKNIYSIAIAWIRGHEELYNVEMSNAKGVIAAKAIDEISRIVALAGGKKETVYGLSGFGDLIATFRGGRNGMLGELLGKGLTAEQALEELKKRGVGVVEGYKTTEKAYKLLKDLENKGVTREGDFPLLRNIYEVLYKNKKVAEVFEELIVH
jgi:glycerol-3-phosphate dehydrogenase (NAD(P)+)